MKPELLDALRRKLRELSRDAVPVDASVFEDDIALITDWTPAKGGGSNFGTHRLVSVGGDRAEFRATRTALAVYSVFLVIGLGVIGTGVAMAGSWGDTLLGRILPSLGLLLFGGVFASIGGGLLYFQAAPIVFDKRRGDYWKGRVAPYEMGRQPPKDFAKLDRIHALQIVSEHCQSDDSSYYSHELNLVLEDGSRLNVVDHGNGGLLRADALALGEFLGRPVWDASVGS